MNSDGLVGAAVGLAALGITLHVAGKMLKTPKSMRQKGSYKLRTKKFKW